MGNRETLLGREEKAVLRDLLVGVLSVPTLLSHRHLAHSPPSALTQTPSPTLWSYPIIARLPPRRYVCCDNTPRAAPSLFSTPSTTSRSRCRCRVERTWLARTCVVGWLRVGWWVLAHGRMGGGVVVVVGRGGGGVVEGLCPPSPHPYHHCTHRRARDHRPAHYSRAPRCTPATIRGKLVQQRQRKRHGARCIHTYRPLSSRAHLVRSYTRATNIRLAHSSSRRSNERGLNVGDNHSEAMKTQFSPNLYM